jgi:excisionase family DNA binding protein
MASDPKRRAGRGRVEVERARISPTLKSPDEVAAYLAVSVLRVYRLLREGRLRGHKVGGQWRIPDDAVREYLEESICVPRKRNRGNEENASPIMRTILGVIIDLAAMIPALGCVAETTQPQLFWGLKSANYPAPPHNLQVISLEGKFPLVVPATCRALQKVPDSTGRRGHIDLLDPKGSQCIHQCIGHNRQCSNGASLAGSLDA